MKVALFEGPHRLKVVDKPLRPLLPGEVLVKVSACGVCGTDVHIVEGRSRSRPPVVIGHEYFGRIEDAGDAGGRIKSGAVVAVDPNISCGTCFYCRRGEVHLCSDLRALGVDIDGGMSEFCIVPAGQLYVLPSDMTAEVGVFVEPLSCAIHGIDRARIRAGDTVVIIGGGTIGLLMLQLARIAGSARTIVVEPLESKRTLAQALGATTVVDPATTDAYSAVMDITGVGADVVIECVGKPETMQEGLRMARRGGTVEFFGVSPMGATIPVEPHQIFFRELTLVGSYVNPHTFDRSITLLRSGTVTVDRFPVHTFSLDDVHEALTYQREGKTLKSIVRPNA